MRVGGEGVGCWVWVGGGGEVITGSTAMYA